MHSHLSLRYLAKGGYVSTGAIHGEQKHSGSDRHALVAIAVRSSHFSASRVLSAGCSEGISHRGDDEGASKAKLSVAEREWPEFGRDPCG